jgi:hypothetical protein
VSWHASYRGIPSVAVAATQFGTPTDCGRLGYSSAFLVIENSSAPVIELAGGALAVGRITPIETAQSECVMGNGHAAECDDHGGCNFDKRSLHDDYISTEGRLQKPITTIEPNKRPSPLCKPRRGCFPLLAPARDDTFPSRGILFGRSLRRAFFCERKGAGLWAGKAQVDSEQEASADVIGVRSGAFGGNCHD